MHLWTALVLHGYLGWIMKGVTSQRMQTRANEGGIRGGPPLYLAK